MLDFGMGWKVAGGGAGFVAYAEQMDLATAGMLTLIPQLYAVLGRSQLATNSSSPANSGASHFSVVSSGILICAAQAAN